MNGGCPSDTLEDLVKETIDKLDAIGLKVLVAISNMGSNFQSLAKCLGITPENPWFMHNNTYFLMFDPPHLLKHVGTI